MTAGALSAGAALRLSRRRPLAVDLDRAAALKRNVHEFVVGAPADRVAEALMQVLAEPGPIGPLEIKRRPEQVGRPFTAGERFHGCLHLLGAFGRTRPGAWLEDTLMSDYAEIVFLEPRRMSYRYLEGSPIAGRSTFELDDLPAGRSRLRVIFEFQERGGAAVTLLHRFGIRLHDEVTGQQIERAARRLGVPLISSTVCR
jgi:hypothetical protein